MDTPTRRSTLLAALLLAACAAEQPPAADASPAPATDTRAVASPPPADGKAGHGLSIEDAWIRSAPPGAAALAGYATLHNAGDSPALVRACPSADFGSTELHQTLHEGGMARMRPVAELVVPADGHALLAPGGTHLMLMQPAELPAVGERVAVCLSVDGEERQVPFEVRAAGAAAMPHDHAREGEHEH